MATVHRTATRRAKPATDGGDARDLGDDDDRRALTFAVHGLALVVVGDLVGHAKSSRWVPAVGVSAIAAE